MSFEPTIIDFSAINVHELRKIAPDYGIKGAGKMPVAGLRAALFEKLAQKNAEAEAIWLAEQANTAQAVDFAPETVYNVEAQLMLFSAEPQAELVQVEPQALPEELVQVEPQALAEVLVQVGSDALVANAMEKLHALDQSVAETILPVVDTKNAGQATATAQRPAKGGKANWSNQTIRLEGQARIEAEAKLKKLILDGGFFTHELADILSMKEGTAYGRLKTQEGNARIRSTLCNANTRKPGKRGEPDMKALWSVKDVKDEAAITIFLGAVIR